MILALGISHKTAPVAVREKVAFTSDQIPITLGLVKKASDANELVLVSTCNRTEFYGHLDNHEALLRAWRKLSHLENQELESHLYYLKNDVAVRHLMRVAAGLDSLVVGEGQILGQLKASYDIARLNGCVGPQLQRLFQKAFMVAKQVRTQTAISKYPVSIAYAAVKLAQNIFSDLKKARVLLIGAGETIELVAQHLKAQGVQNETYANRSLERAVCLAQGNKAIALDDVKDHLSQFDIVISAVSSAQPILSATMVHGALKGHKRHPLFMVDLGLPRNIEKEVGDHEDIYLYNLDDLQAVIAKNIDNRQQEALLAEAIINQHASQFMDWVQARTAIEAVKHYRNKVNYLKNNLIERAYSELALGHDPKKVIECLAHRITQKMLHHPSIRLKRAGESREEAMLNAANELLNIE